MLSVNYVFRLFWVYGWMSDGISVLLFGYCSHDLSVQVIFLFWLVYFAYWIIWDYQFWLWLYLLPASVCSCMHRLGVLWCMLFSVGVVYRAGIARSHTKILVNTKIISRRITYIIVVEFFNHRRKIQFNLHGIVERIRELN